jgi:hypothetical protein
MKKEGKKDALDSAIRGLGDRSLKKTPNRFGGSGFLL